MKYNYFFILTIFLLPSFVTKGQVHCSETLVTNSPTINVWDWRTQFWTVNAYTNGGPSVITSVLSPFYNVDNINLTGISTFSDKDYKPEDGWELIKRNLGNPGELPVTNAYVVFYNKYTAKIRVFFLVTQTFSNTGSSGNSNAAIKIYFLNDNSLYQSNLLTTYSTPLLPLDQLKRDINIRTPNIYFNQLPYWLYSEFPVAYDPCTCGKVGKIRIELTLINSANIEFDLNSVPYQKTVVNGQIDPSKDWLTGFTQIGTQAEGGLKAAKSTGEAFNKMNDAITKQTKVDLQNKLNASLGEVNQIVNTVGNWAGLLPLAGSSVKSVLSLIDYFSAGGKKTTSAAGPAPVMIMNNFKAKGAITSETFKGEVTVAIPGSNQSGVDPALVPTYNNILGVFNLLHTPKVALKEYLIVDDKTTQCCASYNDSGFCTRYNTGGGTYTKKQHLYLNLIDPANDLKYVINPALNIDMAKSDIRAAYIIENCTYGNSNSFTNMQLDLESGPPTNSRPIYRSSYYPIGALKDANPHIYTEQKTVYNNIYCSEMYNGVKTGSICTTPKVYLKIVARFRKIDATKPSEDIIFIAKYPVRVTNESVTETIGGGLENLPEDLVLADGYVVRNYSADVVASKPVAAMNTISVGVLDYPLQTILFRPIIAGEAITLRPGAVIKPGLQILVNPSLIYPSALSQQSLYANSGDISSFCGGPLYNTTTRNNLTARTSADAEEAEVLTREDFFSFYPNPATNQVTFKYFIEAPSPVTLNIFDLQGRSIGQLINDYKDMGDYSYHFDTADLHAGLYIVKFESAMISRTEKLIVIK